MEGVVHEGVAVAGDAAVGAGEGGDACFQLGDSSFAGLGCHRARGKDISAVTFQKRFSCFTCKRTAVVPIMMLLWLSLHIYGVCAFLSRASLPFLKKKDQQHKRSTIFLSYASERIPEGLH